MYNFVYINTHDTGRMIAPYGHAVPTPALQQLAEEGTLFTHAYCCSPTCSPSRAGMLTGKYPHQNGMLGLAQRGFSLNEPSEHLANYLREQGYQTVISGIQHETGWYLDVDAEALQEIGYDTVLTTSSTSYAREDLHLWDRQNVLAAIRWLEGADLTRPFMLTYGMHSTHRPYPLHVADNIDERYVRPPFPGECNEGNRHDQAQFMTSAQHADENVQLLMEALKKKDLLKKTVIIYTTDHGVALPFHKCNLKDTGMGISLILRHPQKGHGIVCDQLISNIDVYPTVCELLGVAIPQGLEGHSFADTLTDPTKAIRDAVYGEVNFHTSYEPMRCVRTHRYKYIRYFDDSWRTTNLSNIDESAQKDFLMAHGLQQREKPMEALYDCYYDPDEVDNRIDDPKLQEVADAMRKKLQRFMETSADPLLQGELEMKPYYKVNKKTCLEASSKNPEDYDPRGRGL